MTDNVKFSQSALSAAACFKRVSINYCVFDSYTYIHVCIILIHIHTYVQPACIGLFSYLHNLIP